MNGRLSDGINFFKKLTLKRSWNILLVALSYLYARVFRIPTIMGNPIALSFEPTTSCNLRCPECPSGLRSFTRPTGMLNDSLFKRLIDEQAGSLMYLLFYFQGEPYLNPNFLEMVSYASDKNIYTATSTNAHYLDDTKAKKTVQSGLDRLIISIDGTTQETYESYRVGGRLEKVIEGTKNVIRWKKELNSSTPHLIFQFLVVAPNEHQIDEIHKLAEELGIDEVRLKTAQIYNHENGSELIPIQDKYSRYKKRKDGTYQIKSKMLNQCWKMWHSCVITWDGKVVPCCFDKDASHQIGDISTSGLNPIWKSQGYTNFRKSVLKSRSEIEMCKNCTEGTTVWA